MGGAGKRQDTVGGGGAGPRAPVAWEQKRRLIEVLVAGIRVDTVEENGVRQTRTTVTYRFSQPGQPMPLVLPQLCNTGRVVRIRAELNTVGDHIRLRRLELKMLQREVAEQIGVGEPGVFTWEANTVSPDIRCIPAIIRFLGSNPLPAADTLSERLVRQRTSLWRRPCTPSPGRQAAAWGPHRN